MITYPSYAAPVLRFGLVILFLWFGLSQVMNVADWTAWVPAWPTELTGLSAETIVFLNGSFEVILGTLLALGLFTRAAALLLSLHLFALAFEIGYNDIGVRDFALAVATLAVFLNGPDQYSVDKRFRNR